MKKFLILSGLVALALTGCVKNDDVVISEEIDFTPVAYKAQKAPILNSVYPEDRPFQVWGYYLKKGQTWSANKNEAIVYMNDAIKYFSETDTWHADKKYYWPAAGTLNFFACSPVGIATDCTPAGGVSIEDYTVDNITDVLVADTVIGKTMNDKTGRAGVDMKMKHIVSMVDFKIAADKDYSDPENGGFIIKLKSVALNNIYTTGTFDQFSDGKSFVWSDQKDASSLKFTSRLASKGGQQVPMGINYNKGEYFLNDDSQYGASATQTPTMVLPQTIMVPAGAITDSATMVVEYTIGQVIDGDTLYGSLQLKDWETRTKAVKLSSAKIPDWKPNKKYVYTLILSFGEEILFDPEVVEFEEPEITDEKQF